ncbi:MAG: ribonuclease III [Deltaproteobacteria bacterium]|nr:ribonuclease III [Deltaproteobacteria bacterium]
MHVTTDEKKRLKILEKKLGYVFKDKTLLKRALTHKSYTNELKISPLEHNERIEFLGDAVMELAVSHLLMHQYRSHPEGELSKLRAAIVNEGQLAELAGSISLGDFLYLGKGEDQTGGRQKPSLLSDAYEAVLGAIYLDRGFLKVFALVKKHFSALVEKVGAEGFAKDYKTRLQETVQGRFHTIPKYKMVKAEGPDHSKIFEINLYIQETLYGVGQGKSKKSAEQDAASQALERLLREKP